MDTNWELKKSCGKVDCENCGQPYRYIGSHLEPPETITTGASPVTVRTTPTTQVMRKKMKIKRNDLILFGITLVIVAAMVIALNLGLYEPLTKGVPLK